MTDVGDKFRDGGEKIKLADAEQSSNWTGSVAGLAINGDTSGAFKEGGMQHTLCDDQAWWKAKFGAAQEVVKVVIHNRTDCCMDRIAGAKVELRLNGKVVASEVVPKTTWTVFESGEALKGVEADEVFVQLPGKQYLHMAELEVYGKKVPSGNCGHVFILNVDSTGLAADAILLANAVPDGSVQDAGQCDGMTHIFHAPALTLDPIETTLSESVTIVNQYFEIASGAVKKSVFGRAKPLFALPLFGAGSTDITDTILQEGLFVRTMLPLMYEAANKHGVDVALCTTSVAAYKILQVQREALCPFSGGPFWMLLPQLKAEAERLAAIAKNGSLSIFFGAGVSFPSGLPSWGGLLSSLAEEGHLSVDERKALSKLDYLDQPSIIEERMGTKKFRAAIAKLVGGGLFTPCHAILSDMQVPTATTNYDDLFERSANSDVLRLPWDSNTISESTSGSRRSVIKIHGCVSQPESIVLTRKDYMRYGSNRQAVRGLIHQQLLTTHIVFVGFSMTDTNLHLVIDDVRRSLESGVDPEGTLGTILCMTENSMFRELWDQDFGITSFGASWSEKPGPAWMHDCFLDSVGSAVAKAKAISSFVLDPKYAALLSRGELKIKEALLPVLNLSDDEDVTSSPVWLGLQAMLEKFGASSSAN